MKQLNLKDTNLPQMPALGFGTWKLKGADCIKAVQTALDTGYTHIDTAQIYDNETEVGQAILESGLRRDKIFLTTKVWTTNFTRDTLRPSVEESLDKLKTDRVDLLLLHWPNPSVPLGQTLEALQDVQARGMTKAIGVSNFPTALLRECVEDHHAPIRCNQVEFHPLLQQNTLLSYMRSQGIVLTAYSPLAQGQLTKHPLLTDIGAKYGKSAGQIALRWLVEQDDVAAIPKSATPDNIRANFDIFDFELSDDDRAKINALGSPQGRTINPAFSPQWDAA